MRSLRNWLGATATMLWWSITTDPLHTLTAPLRFVERWVLNHLAWIIYAFAAAIQIPFIVGTLIDASKPWVILNVATFTYVIALWMFSWLSGRHAKKVAEIDLFWYNEMYELRTRWATGEGRQYGDTTTMLTVASPWDQSGPTNATTNTATSPIVVPQTRPERWGPPAVDPYDINHDEWHGY